MLKRLFIHAQTIIIISVLICLITLFYLSSSNISYGSFLWEFIVVTLFTDFIFLGFHIFRKPIEHKKLSFDPSKVTAVIACYNGENIIGETIEHALRHLPKKQIMVISDASTDNTAGIAQKYGVRVMVNSINVNKAFSISSVAKKINTPYVLILDDDTFICDTLIPTSLLDDGYDGVAFNVMPVEENNLFNKLQSFEYRKSMLLGKSSRAGVGSIGNISGAIGLFKREDLILQQSRHSGEFGGEDLQRTSLIHLARKGKGITYTNEIIKTKVPNNFKSLFKQRAFRWNLSLPELFSIYWRIMVNSKSHYLLKIEMAYQMFLYATDPLRALLIWLPLFYPLRLTFIYSFYLFLSIAVWIKLDRKDPFWVILIFPIYRQAEIICRLIAHFYWLKIKYYYVFKMRFQRFVTNRKVVMEYSIVVVFIVFLWFGSIAQINSKITTMKRSEKDLNMASHPVQINLNKIDSEINQYKPTISINSKSIVRANE